MGEPLSKRLAQESIDPAPDPQPPLGAAAAAESLAGFRAATEAAITAANERRRREYEAFKAAPSIDAAWARCEAALPEHGYIKVAGYSDMPGVYTVEVWSDDPLSEGGNWVTVVERVFQRPLAAAIEALAARLEARR